MGSDKKVYLYYIAAIVVVLLGVYLFATKNVIPKDVVQIRWSVDPSDLRDLTIENYEKTHPNIHIVIDPNPDMQSILTQLAGNVAPDIVTTYTIDTFRRLQRLNQLEDLTPYIEEYNINVKEVRPELWPFMRIAEDDPRVFGIPDSAGPYLLYFNKDVFDKYGVEYPTNDMTWDEMYQKAKTLTTYKTVNGRKVVNTKGLDTGVDSEFYIRMYGGRIFSPDGKKCIIDKENAKIGLRQWENLHRKDRILPTSSDLSVMGPSNGLSGAGQLIAAGKVAMLLSGRHVLLQLRENYPKGVRIGTVRCPKSPCINNLLNSKCFCIPKKSKHKKEAAEFLAYILSDENQMLVNDYADGWSAISNPEIDKKAEFNPKYPQEDNNKELLKDFDGSGVREMSPYINETDLHSICGMEYDYVWQDLQSMDTAADHIRERVDKIIQRNLKNPNFIN